jgi:hypothetical protein
LYPSCVETKEIIIGKTLRTIPSTYIILVTERPGKKSHTLGLVIDRASVVECLPNMYEALENSILHNFLNMKYPE